MKASYSVLVGLIVGGFGIALICDSGGSPEFAPLSVQETMAIHGGDGCIQLKLNPCGIPIAKCFDTKCDNNGTEEEPDWECPHPIGDISFLGFWGECDDGHTQGYDDCSDPTEPIPCQIVVACATTCLVAQTTKQGWCQQAGPDIPLLPHQWTIPQGDDCIEYYVLQEQPSGNSVVVPARLGVNPF